MEDKDYFNEKCRETARSLGMEDEFNNKAEEIRTRHVIKTLERVLSKLKNHETLDDFKWHNSPAGDGYGEDSILVNLTPELPVETMLEHFYTGKDFGIY